MILLGFTALSVETSMNFSSSLEVKDSIKFLKDKILFFTEFNIIFNKIDMFIGSCMKNYLIITLVLEFFTESWSQRFTK